MLRRDRTWASWWREICGLSAALAALVSAGCFLGSITGDDCEAKTYYGPPPCQSDQSCVDQYGSGWYCDKEHVVDQSCGTKWPTCLKR